MTEEQKLTPLIFRCKCGNVFTKHALKECELREGTNKSGAHSIFANCPECGEEVQW